MDNKENREINEILPTLTKKFNVTQNIPDSLDFHKTIAKSMNELKLSTNNLNFIEDYKSISDKVKELNPNPIIPSTVEPYKTFLEKIKELNAATVMPNSVKPYKTIVESINDLKIASINLNSLEAYKSISERVKELNSNPSEPYKTFSEKIKELSASNNIPSLIEPYKTIAERINPTINSLKTLEATKTLAESIQSFNSIKATEATKTLANSLNNFSPSIYNLNSIDTAEKIKELTKNINPILDNTNFSYTTEKIIKDLQNINPPKLPFDVYLNSISGKTKISIIENSNSDYLNKNNSKTIDTWIETLSSGEKIGLSYCLRYDIYPPLNLLDKIPFTQKFNSQREADRYLNNLFLILEENDKNIFDCVPKTIHNQKDIDKIKTLYDLGFNKILMLYIFERIDNLIYKIRKKYSKNIKGRIGYQIIAKEFFETIKLNTEDSDLKDSLEELFEIKNYNKDKYFKLNLYESYSNNEEILSKLNTEEIPLNRNIFMHGLVQDEHVSEMLTKKAILAFGFFTSLVTMIENNWL